MNNGLLKDRSTTDIVVILFTTMVAVAMILMIIGATVAKLVDPKIDLRTVGELFGNILTTIVGALVGFVGGRAAGRAEANGQLTKQPTNDSHDQTYK